ncbi:MAG: hypothetical protein CM15mV8_0100 [Caudoviricetes sp.]|nr:MAG: hypothetical protein CM15mV8_0100 [Caudoviricetes sp.]
MQVTSIESTDGIALENETGRTDNLLIDGTKTYLRKNTTRRRDKIIYEDTSYGKFTLVKQ